LPEALPSAAVNRVIETDTNGNIVWQFGLGPKDFSPDSIIGCNDAQRVGPFTLMAGTGTPAGVIPEAPDGAPDNRVILVDPNGRIVWQYPGSNTNDSDQLNSPNSAELLENGHILISDENNDRVIRVSPAGQIVASYGLPLAGGGSIGNNVGYDLQTTQNGLYSPYDAKVVGDYTGLTPPFEFQRHHRD
jgi:hypothetical protein